MSNRKFANKKMLSDSNFQKFDFQNPASFEISTIASEFVIENLKKIFVNFSKFD